MSLEMFNVCKEWQGVRCGKKYSGFGKGWLAGEETLWTGQELIHRDGRAEQCGMEAGRVEGMTGGGNSVERNYEE